MNDPLFQPVDPRPAAWPSFRAIQGDSVRLERLESRHFDGLYAALHGPDREALWLFLSVGPFATREHFAVHMAPKLDCLDPWCFVLVDPADGNALGMASLMRIDPQNRVVEIGYVAFSPALQKTRAATEAHYLLASYVFEALGCRRYEWKCDNLNERSKSAALRLGFRFEGVFRQHMIVKGRNRDTAWFAMLDHEWPAAKTALEAWLARKNFDAQGRQKQRLADLREAARRAKSPA